MTVVADRLLTVVSGKGGVGKTSVATALAEAHAARGRATLLIDQGGEHPRFGIAARPDPVLVADRLWLACIEPRRSLKEYLRRRTAFGAMYTRLVDNPAVARLLDALPAFDELMTLGKLYDHCTAALSPFERVVFDAPSTGHCKTLLSTPRAALETLIGGPVLDAARKVQQLLTDPDRARLLIVALPEETPVAEALDLEAFARDEVGMACGPFIVNRVEPELLPARDIEALRTVPHARIQALADAFEMLDGVHRVQKTHLRRLAEAGPLLSIGEAPEAAPDARIARLRETFLACLE